jgi:hypothetical protein
VTRAETVLSGAEDDPELLSLPLVEAYKLQVDAPPAIAGVTPGKIQIATTVAVASEIHKLRKRPGRTRRAGIGMLRLLR